MRTAEPGPSLVGFRGDAERAEKTYQGLQCLRPDDVADAITFALTRPAHVNIGEIVLWPTDQASTTVVKRATGNSSRYGGMQRGGSAVSSAPSHEVPEVQRKPNPASSGSSSWQPSPRRIR